MNSFSLPPSRSDFRNFRIAMFFVTLFTFCSLPSSAQELQPKGQKLQLNGMAIHSALRHEVYIGALYVVAPSSSADELRNSEQDKKMVLRILSSRWSKRGFAQYWTQSILINTSEKDLANNADTVLAFTSALGGKLTSGDEVVINNPMGGILTMSVNGVEVFSLAKNGNKFFALLLNAWIGPRPSSSTFKNDILSKPSDINTLEAIFDDLVATDTRIAEVKAWPTAASSDAKQRQQVTTAAVAVAVAKPKPGTQPTATQANKEASQQAAKARARARAKAKDKADAVALAAKAEADRLAAEQRLAAELEQRNARLLLLYRSNIIKQIYSHVVYPSRAIDRHQEADVELLVRLNRRGKLIDTTINNDAPHKLLNDAAVRAARSAAPFPAVPEKLPGEEIELLIPVRFQMPD